MFGGLDVKGPEAVSAAAPTLPASGSASSFPTAAQEEQPSLLSALNGSDEASSFSFMADDGSGGDSATAGGGGVDASSGFSFISTEESGAFEEPTEQNSFVPEPQPAATGAPQDRLASVKSYIARCLVQFWTEWRQLVVSESGLKQEETQLQQSVRDNTTAVRETEDRQGAAVAAEEYEKADSYNAELDRLKAAIQSAHDRLKAVRSEIDVREGRKRQQAEAILGILNESSLQLQELTAERQQELTSFISAQVSQLKATDEQVRADLQRVEEQLQLTQGELDAIQREEEQLTEAVKAETAPFVDEKESLLTEAHRLERELEELKRQVVAKMKEIQANKEKQSSAERAVEVVKAKSVRERQRILEKRNRVDNARSRDVRERKQVEVRRQQLEDDIARDKQKERQYRLTLHDMAEQLAHAQHLSSLISADSLQRDAFHAALRHDEQQLSSLQHALDSHDETQEKSRSELSQLETQLETHHSNVAAVSAKIPQMETEKKAAVAARDFKKAATASNEIKALQQSKAESEAAMDELRARVDKLRSELGSADETKVNIAREMKKLEEEADRRRLQYLLSREAKLSRRQQRAQELMQRPGREEAGGSGGSDYLQREVESVDVELRWTQVEIKEVRGKYGWREGEVRAAEAEGEEEEEAEVVSHVDDPSPFDSFKSAAATNGIDRLGVPVIAPRKSSSALTPSASASHLAAAAAAKPTQADLDSLLSTLSEARSSQSGHEEKLAEAEAAEDFEKAAELQDVVTKEQQKVQQLEAKLAELRQQLGDDSASQSSQPQEEESKQPPAPRPQEEEDVFAPEE